MSDLEIPDVSRNPCCTPTQHVAATRDAVHRWPTSPTTLAMPSRPTRQRSALPARQDRELVRLLDPPGDLLGLPGRGAGLEQDRPAVRHRGSTCPRCARPTLSPESSPATSWRPPPPSGRRFGDRGTSVVAAREAGVPGPGRGRPARADVTRLARRLRKLRRAEDPFTTELLFVPTLRTRCLR